MTVPDAAPMTCREFVLLFLADWLGDELPPLRAHACDRHAQTCRDCAEYVRSYREVTRRLSCERLRVRARPVPEELVQAILARAG